MSCFASSSEASPHSTVPAEGACTPQSMWMVVLLPAPFEPSSPKHSSGLKANCTFCTAFLVAPG